jgi:sortase A
LRFSFLRFAQRLFIGVGLVILAYAGGTIAYAEFYQRYQSTKFGQEVFATPVAPVPALPAAPPELAEGDMIGKLEIPRIGISVMVLQGVEEGTLRLGAGHVPGTPLPGADGNSAIAGHRDTFFRKLEGIHPGDRLEFASVRGISVFVVDSTEIVEPEDTRVIESRGHAELTLVSCFPFYFVGAAPHRFIVHALPAKF